MKRLWKVIRHYYLFAVAAVAVIAAAVLDLSGLDAAAHWLLAIVAALELLPFLAEIWRDMRAGKYGVDILAAVAIFTSLALQEFWAAIVIVLMLTGGRALEDYANHRAERDLDALLSKAPQKAHVLRGRKEIEIKATEVRKGDKLIIRPGELVPVDAVILEGAANFDESSLTGESLPQPKDVDDQILSGSINLDGPVTAHAIHSAEDSQYQQIIKLVASARNSQAPFVRMADRYALPFTIVSFAIAFTAWFISGEAIRFLEVIVVATPCPLILAVPVAIISGMSRATRQGIIIKSGKSLEQMAGARTFAFDKTGTLTRGVLKVEKVTTYGKTSRTELLSLSASLERHSRHAQAAAIIAKAEAEHAKIVPVKQVREIAGKGLVAHLKGKDIIIGRRELLEERGVTFPKDFSTKKHDQTAAYVAFDGQLTGVFAFADEIREESKSTLQKLKEAGVYRLMMITGDNATTAKSVAKRLGIPNIVSGALPGEKIHAIEQVQDRPVAFVGDGVNDAPVLTASDVGIALGARGAAAASESADVVIMLDDLGRVAKGVQIARRTLKIARQSVFVGIGLSVVLMLIFATGRFTPVYGALIQEVVDVVVIFNALRAVRGQ